MKHTNKKRLLGLSVVAALFIATGVDAGKIVTNATYTGGTTSSSTAIVTPSKQFGFGGWNLDNVVVKITDLLFAPIGGKTFNETDGTYSPMILGESFESEIWNAGNTEVRGRLHGKNWPVGEPSGIKIINADTHVQHGKPENCIINSSYLEGFYLDSATPQPVICSSDFQTHKRFKINMLSTMVNGDGAWGNPVDMVFNLDPADTSAMRYQVFQKINNYTGKRLDGYKIEVLDENGTVNPALTLSLGVGEDTSTTPAGDIFAFDARATFSDGLWGPVDTQHDRPRGFFDDRTAYYNVPDNLHSNVIVGGTDGFLGANYQDLFGNWLTSVWAPKGVFWDFDNDPLTDATLVAFYGKDPTNPASTDAWRKGEVGLWAPLTADEIVQYSGAGYAVDVVEDTLNLGINYIVEIGNNALIGSKFTIRITPHTDANQTAPSYVGNVAGDYLTYTGNQGRLTITPAPTFVVASALQVTVADADLNTNTLTAETQSVTVTTSKGETEVVLLTETGLNTGIFTGTLTTVDSSTAGASGDDNVVSADIGTTVSVTYLDTDSDGAGTDVALTASTSAVVVTAPVVPTVSSDGSGGGFDAFDKTSLIAMILGFLGIGAFIARRKLAKKGV